jgi:hypothetical protein
LKLTTTIQPNQQEQARVDAAAHHETVKAMKALGFNDDECLNVFRTLAGILLLGNIPLNADPAAPPPSPKAGLDNPQAEAIGAEDEDGEEQDEGSDGGGKCWVSDIRVVDWEIELIAYLHGKRYQGELNCLEGGWNSWNSLLIRKTRITSDSGSTSHEWKLIGIVEKVVGMLRTHSRFESRSTSDFRSTPPEWKILGICPEDGSNSCNSVPVRT